MRNLEDIEKDLAEAREALSSVEGTPAEVYSRIVGYYRSVRNWNLGKREEYGERRLFHFRGSELGAAGSSPFPQAAFTASPPDGGNGGCIAGGAPIADMRLLLFVRDACPGCPPAKNAASRLGIPVQLVDAGTAEGLEEAARHNVLSTPTGILLSHDGEELRRARDAEAIGALAGFIASFRAEPIAV